MKRFDVITVGGATEDIISLVDDYVMVNNPTDPLRAKLVGFEYGAKIGITDLHSGFGGGAVNTSIAFSRLGKRVAAHVCLGNDARGDRIIQALVKYKVDTRFVHRGAGESGLSFVLKTVANDHVLFTHRGANDRLEMSRSIIKALRKVKRVYLSSLSGSWRTTISQVMEASDTVAWNPGRLQLAAGYSVLKGFLSSTDILILNKDEATQLYLSKASVRKGAYSVSQLLRALSQFGPQLIVITDGGKGASAICNKEIYNQKSLSSKVIDTTGVGDAFAATFVASFDLHRDIARALRAAAKNAAAVVAKSGSHQGLKTASELGL